MDQAGVGDARLPQFEHFQGWKLTEMNHRLVTDRHAAERKIVQVLEAAQMDQVTVAKFHGVEVQGLHMGEVPKERQTGVRKTAASDVDCDDKPALVVELHSAIDPGNLREGILCTLW